MEHDAPVAVVPLAYVEPDADNAWAAVVRLGSMTLLAQGITLVAPLIELSIGLLTRGFRSIFPMRTTEALLGQLSALMPMAAGVLLVVGWFLMRKRRAEGWWCATIGEVIVIAAWVVQPILSFFRYSSMSMPRWRLTMAITDTALWTSSLLVLPVFMLVFLRRHQVRAILAGA